MTDENDVVSSEPAGGGASASVDDDDDFELPPALEQLVEELSAGRKRLLKEKSFDRADQQKQFIAQFIIPQMQQIIELLGDAYMETYEMAAGTASSSARFQRTALHHFKELGVKVDVAQGYPSDALEKLQQALYVMGSMLAKKLPNDREMQDVYNTCMSGVAELIGISMGNETEEVKDTKEPEEVEAEK